LEAFCVFTVLAAPERTTVDVPLVNVDPEPEVSQFPETLIVPVVRERVSAEPSFIVTFVKVIVDEVAVRVPPPWTTRFAPPVILFPEVVSVPVIETELLTSTAVLCVIVPLTVTL
jgi:hypothetical protein